MSDRERWIVYPLLFLALGTAFRGNMSNHTETGVLDAEVVRCSRLLVGEGATDLPATSIPPGTIVSLDKNTKSQVVIKSSPATITTYNNQGNRQVSIGSKEFRVRQNLDVESGIMTVHDHEGKQIVALRANYKPIITKHVQGGENPEGRPKQQVITIRDAYHGGGQIEVFDKAKQHALVLEHLPAELGLYATDSNNVGLHFRLAHIPKQNPRRSANQPPESNPSAPGPASKLPSAPEPTRAPGTDSN